MTHPPKIPATADRLLRVASAATPAYRSAFLLRAAAADWSGGSRAQAAFVRSPRRLGLHGAKAVAEAADVSVVVDVLSFTTTLSVALDAGTAVLPYRWNDESAAVFAQEQDAVLAVGRSSAGPGQISLSPITLRATPAPPRLVLPSPNGSTIAHHLATATSMCLGASLRNATAVTAWVASRCDPEATSVAIIAAGEQWPGGGLRPAVEDLWGAGFVVDRLARLGWSGLSPEAAAARAAWLAAADHVSDALLACASGRELADKGYGADVEIAAEVDTSHSVPLLQDLTFSHPQHGQVLR